MELGSAAASAELAGPEITACLQANARRRRLSEHKVHKRLRIIGGAAAGKLLLVGARGDDAPHDGEGAPPAGVTWPCGAPLLCHPFHVLLPLLRRGAALQGRAMFSRSTGLCFYRRAPGRHGRRV